MRFRIPPSATASLAALFLLLPASAVAPALSAPPPLSSARPAGLDSSSVTAKFDDLVLNESRQMLFFYVLLNHTSRSILIPSGATVTLSALLRNHATGQVELVPLDPSLMRISYPISLAPAQRHILTMRDLAYTYPTYVENKENPTPADQARYEARLRSLVRKHFPNLEGFVLTERSLRLRIDLPRGW